MKKKITTILLTIVLLAGCETAPATTPDIESIVQQLVAEAIAQYEETQKEKDAEIAGLRAQLEELTSHAEETPDAAEPPETTPAEEPPASSQPEEPETQPEPESEESIPARSSASSSRYDGFNLRNIYPAFM